MDAAKSRQRLTGLFAKLGGGTSRLVLPVAPMAAMIAATLVALVVLAMPIDSLESMVTESGISTMITAAEPPLGATGRFAIAFIAALAVGAIVWFGTFLLIGARTVILKRGKREDGVPVLRRADAHPDAPARRPVFANSDLGTPFLDVKADPEPVTFVPPEVATDIPADLDTPLAAYLTPTDEPLPEPEPLPIVRAPEPVAPPPIMAELPVPEPSPELEALAPAPIAPPRFAPHERIETFELTPMVRPAPAPEPQPATETSAPLAPATIHDLLARLERGVQRRADVAPTPAPVVEEPAEPSLEDTLAVLRQLASRVG